MSPTPSHSGPKTRGTDCGHRDFLPIRNAVKLYAIIMIAIVTAGIRDGVHRMRMPEPRPAVELHSHIVRPIRVSAYAMYFIMGPTYAFHARRLLGLQPLQPVRLCRLLRSDWNSQSESEEMN